MIMDETDYPVGEDVSVAGVIAKVGDFFSINEKWHCRQAIEFLVWCHVAEAFCTVETELLRVVFFSITKMPFTNHSGRITHIFNVEAMVLVPSGNPLST